MVEHALICIHCESDFIGGKRWAKYCSRLCAGRAWAQKNPKQRSNLNRKHLMLRYGITQREYEKMLVAQNNKCAICKTTDPGGPGGIFGVDHNHKTGKVRGLLCSNCNTALGLFKDNKEMLCSAIKYIT